MFSERTLERMRKKIIAYLCRAMETRRPGEEDYSFWTKYKRFASNEILLYVLMTAGILLGIILFS